MESILAIGAGLVLRVVVDVATDNDGRVGGVLVGLWEGVVLNHFVRRMPRSIDPYLGFGFRVFVDFLFTQSISRLALVVLWALVGMLLADIAPNLWRDSGLRHLYRQVRRDVRHVKRAVPRIRIKNDLPSVRLFNQPRSTSANASSSVRSDIATPSRSRAPSPAPAPGPARRPGRSPPGTFPNVSGWSETGTDLSTHDRPIPRLVPSPSLVSSRERAAYQRVDTTHATTSEIRTIIVQDTMPTATPARKKSPSLGTARAATVGAVIGSTSLKPAEGPPRLDPPTIPDDWVDIHHPTPAPANEPVVPFQPDSDSSHTPQPRPSPPAPSRSVSMLAPTVIEIPLDPPEIDVDNRVSQPPDLIPLPESRAASVIGGVYDQPQPRSALRDSLRSRIDKATSEIGLDSGKSPAQPVTKQSTKNQSSLRTWVPFLSQPKQQVDAGAPEPPPKEALAEPAKQSKLDVSSATQGVELQIPTPAQVDPPANILTQPGDTSPLLLAPAEPKPKQQEHGQATKPDPLPAHAGADGIPAPLSSEASKRDTMAPCGSSLLDLPSPTRSPPPPFTEFAGVPVDPAIEEKPAEEDPVTQDEPPTELTEEQKAAEEKRMGFLLVQVRELEQTRSDLRKKLEDEDDPTGGSATSIWSDLKDAEKTLEAIEARMARKKFSALPSSPQAREISLASMSQVDIQFALTSAVLDELLTREDADRIIIRTSFPKKKKNVVDAFARRYQFFTRSDGANASTMSITL